MLCSSVCEDGVVVGAEGGRDGRRVGVGPCYF